METPEADANRLEGTTFAVSAALPNATEVAPVRLSPDKVTAVPPDSGPQSGMIPLKEGTGRSS